jgi:flagellar protein FlbD
MILVKKINKQEILVNSDLIESVEFCPHAVVALTSGVKLILDESPESLIRKIVDYKRSVRSRGTHLRVVPRTATTGTEE